METVPSGSRSDLRPPASRLRPPQSACRGAITRRDITPPVGIYHRMWGAATHDRSTGVHRPLTATALVLAPTRDNLAESDAAAEVLVSIDHCLLWSEDLDSLRRDVCRLAAVEPARLHTTFTHTHAAGLMDRARADLPGGELIGPYLDQTAERIAEAVREALDKLVPVRIVYGTGRCGLAANRDFWDEASGQFVCGFNPDGPSDDTVLVARITDEHSRTLGTIVNYACHPTTLAWDNTLISPDYVGATREVVEQATGGMCLFLQGAAGDLGPRRGYVGDTAVADRNGRELGYAALATLEALPPAGCDYQYAGPVVSGATIGTWRDVPLVAESACAKHRWRAERFAVDLDYRDGLPTRGETQASRARHLADETAAQARGDAEAARRARAEAERMTRQLARLRGLPPGKTVPLAASLWQLGDACWVFVAAEHYQVLQRQLRARFPAAPLVVTTLTDGWLPGYVPTAETYGRGIYQESIALVAPDSSERVIEALAARIDACLGS